MVWFFVGAFLMYLFVWCIGTIQLRAEQKWLRENAQMVSDIVELPQDVVMEKYGWTESEYTLQRQVSMNYLKWEVYG